MKITILVTALSLSLSTFAINASAEQDPATCKEIANMAWNIANDRDQGTSYHAELGKLKGAAEDAQAGKMIMKIANPMLKVLYKDQPNLAPNDAFKSFFTLCMKAGN